MTTNKPNIGTALPRLGRVLLGVALIVAASIALAPPVVAQGAEAGLVPYSARYAVYRNGKLQARSEFILEKQNNIWVMKSESIGTHGMARLVKFRDFEYVEGIEIGGRFRPESYLHDLKWIGPNQSSSASFNWQSGKVTVTEDGDTMVLDLVDGAVDPMSLQLELRRRLAEGSKNLEFVLVKEDEIETQLFRQLEKEWLETSLGCLQTTPVERVREGSTRFTRLWLASKLGMIPVRMEHGKTDGDHMELRITELVIDGATIDPEPGCASRPRNGG